MTELQNKACKYIKNYYRKSEGSKALSSVERKQNLVLNMRNRIDTFAFLICRTLCLKIRTFDSQLFSALKLLRVTYSHYSLPSEMNIYYMIYYNLTNNSKVVTLRFTCMYLICMCYLNMKYKEDSYMSKYLLVWNYQCDLQVFFLIQYHNPQGKKKLVYSSYTLHTIHNNSWPKTQRAAKRTGNKIITHWYEERNVKSSFTLTTNSTCSCITSN